MRAAPAAAQVPATPRWAKATVTAGVGVIIVITALTMPVPVRPYLDFQVLYQTDMALLHGITPYDHAGQVKLIAEIAHVQPQQVNVLPFPYPPWYVLSTLWLAWLPIETAARIWFALSIVLLLSAMWLLTDGLPTLGRVAACSLAIIYLPVPGSLLVGQYGFPVLLGAALMTYALRHENAFWTAVAAGLLTFKPHLGIVILLAAVIHLLRRRDGFARKAMLYGLGAATLLFCSGFLADAHWLANYLASLMDFRRDAGVASCTLCASLPAMASGLLGGGLYLASAFGAMLFVALACILFARRRAALLQPDTLIAAATLVLLLASPYLLNYDFVLLLVPLTWLAARAHSLKGWIAVGIIYLMPFFALGLFGRQGNPVFPLCALLLFVLLYWDTRLLDGSPAGA